MPDGERGPENEYTIHPPPHPQAHKASKNIHYRFDSASRNIHEGYSRISLKLSVATGSRRKPRCAFQPRRDTRLAPLPFLLQGLR